METKYTKQQIEQLNKMNRGAFVHVKQHWFDAFYDYIGNFIHNGKSIAPVELKRFR